MFWLGGFVLGTLTKQMESFYDLVHKLMRKWSNDAVVRSLLSLMVLLNPRLSGRQQRHLMLILPRTVDGLIWEHSLDIRVMSGIMALACPNQDTGLLFGYLMEVIAGLACYDGQVEEVKDLRPKAALLDLESPMLNSLQTDEQDVKAAQALIHHFTIDQAYVAAMSTKVRKAVLAALNGGMEFPPQLQNWVLLPKQSSPICCITLEPLLCHDGTITPDVVALTQKGNALGKEHVFLYRGKALYEWLGQSSVPRNPETRSLVRPTDIYRLS